MDQGRGAEWGVGESGWTMSANVGRCHVAPRLLRGRDDDRLEHDRSRRVVGLWREVGEHDGDGMLAGIATLDTCAIIRTVGVRMVKMCDGRVFVGRRAVVMFGVIVVRVRVHMLQRR